MSRILPNWIKGFQYWMSESEAPDSYIIWAAISAIAGATQRKIWLTEGYHKQYTNKYIILVGPAGIVHKSTTIDQIRQMYREIQIPTCSESLTREELINQMVKRNDGTVAALTAMPDELSDMLRPSGHTMVEFLTTMYNSPDFWEYSTRLRGVESIENAFLNMLGGTTPTWIANEFDITFVDQGFAARTLFVHEMEPRFMKARPVISDEMHKARKALVEDLHHISQLRGQFEWEADALAWHDNWYNTILKGERAGLDYKLKAYGGRKDVHVKRLAMCLQLAESDELLFTLKNITEAKLLLDTLEASMVRTFSSVGRNTYANDLERIYAEIKAAGGMSIMDITTRNFAAMPKMALDEVLQTLRTMGKLRVEVNEKGQWYHAK